MKFSGEAQVPIAAGILETFDGRYRGGQAPDMRSLKSKVIGHLGRRLCVDGLLRHILFALKGEQRAP